VIGVADELIEQMQAFYDAMGRDDRDGAVAVIEGAIHPDCEMTSVIGGGVEGRMYRGTDGLVDFVNDILGSFEVSYEDRDLKPVGAHVLLCLTQVHLKGRESGAELVQPMGLVVESSGGKVTRISTYPSHEEARSVAESLHA
jgi:hypothetical protein